MKYPDDTAALYQLDAVGNRVGERKAPGSLVPLLASPLCALGSVVSPGPRADKKLTISKSP